MKIVQPFLFNLMLRTPFGSIWRKSATCAQNNRELPTPRISFKQDRRYKKPFRQKNEGGGFLIYIQLQTVIVLGTSHRLAPSVVIPTKYYRLNQL